MESLMIINRIFSKKLFHYEGKIHEQVSHLKGKDYETYILPVTIGHSGYDMPEEERKQKARRNIKLLDLELKSLINEKIRNVCNSGQEDTQKYLEILSETLQREDEFAHSLQQDDRMPYILYQLGKGRNTKRHAIIFHCHYHLT